MGFGNEEYLDRLEAENKALKAKIKHKDDVRSDMKQKEALDNIEAYIDPTDNDILEALKVIKAELKRKDTLLQESVELGPGNLCCTSVCNKWLQKAKEEIE